MKDCANHPACANLIDPDARVYCSRCRPAQTADELAADLAEAGLLTAAERPPGGGGCPKYT